MAIQVLEHFKIGSSTIQMGISLLIAVLAYTGLYMFVKISKIEVKNFNLNLATLFLVDVGSFGYIYYRKSKLKNKNQDQDLEKKEEAKLENENVEHQ